METENVRTLSPKPPVPKGTEDVGTLLLEAFNGSLVLGVEQ